MSDNDVWNQGRRDKQQVFEGTNRRQGDRRKRSRRKEDLAADLTIKIVLVAVGALAYFMFNMLKGFGH